jgi:hypothetical protein
MYLIVMIDTQRGKRFPTAAKGSRGQRARLVDTFSVDEPRYLLGQVAFAAGISTSVLKAWVTRKVIPMGEHDREAHGKGSSRVFTLRRALSVGLAAELVRMGITAAFAGQIGSSAVDLALRNAGGDALRIDDLIALYPVGDGNTSFRGAAWNFTIKTMLERNAPPDEMVSSFMVISVKAVAERVLQRLGELE